MKASVIVPVYNSIEFLDECLDSLLAQTFADFEIICIDDGSTDGSREKLQCYAERQPGKIKVLSQPNQGPGAARMAGIACAQGEYLLFLDSDDFAEPEMIERAVRTADEAHADVVVWDVWYYNQRFDRRQVPSAGTVRRDEFATESGIFSWKDNPDSIFTSFQNWPWNKLFRASFVVSKGITFGPFHRTEDLQFTAMALVEAERIVCLEDRLVNYRIGRAESAMGDKDSYPFDLMDAFILLKRTLEARGVYGVLEKSFVNWAVSGVIFTLNTLRTKEAYEAVCGRLLGGGLEEMGVMGAGPDVLAAVWQRDDLDRFLSLGPDGYAFYRSRVLNDFVEDLEAKEAFAEVEMENLRGSVEARGKEIDRLYVEWDKSNQWARGLERDLADLERRYIELENATEQKVGRAICAIPRAIQRKMLGKG